MSMSGSAKLAGVMGWPVGHSLSPRLHGFWLDQYKIDGAYVPLAVEPKNVTEVIRSLPKLGFKGLNVTVPYKETVMAAVDHVDDLAKRIGAVNTVIIQEDGTSLGTNTDGFGFIENIRQSLPNHDFTSAPSVIFGSGGAARALIVALIDAGSPEIRILNRTIERAEALQKEIAGPTKVINWSQRSDILDDIGLLVNSTTLGMKNQPPLDMDLAGLNPTAVVNDIVYAPLETDLLKAARDRSNKTVDGIGMLLHQARPGFKQWFDHEPQVTPELRDYVLGFVG